MKEDIYEVDTTTCAKEEGHSAALKATSLQVKYNHWLGWNLRSTRRPSRVKEIPLQTKEAGEEEDCF